MNIDIDGLGYSQASGALHDGNQWAARYFGVLGDALAGGGSMAGDSSFAEPFATAYDESTRVAMLTFVDLVTSYANLGRYVAASLENHTRAELASTLGRLVVSDESDVLSDDWYAVTPIEVPSSLGGDPSSMPGWANWILDQVEGFIWPDADLDRLRETAGGWRAAADDLDYVASHADIGVRGLCLERSAEIPLAVHTLNELASATRDLGAHCASLGTACDDYAAAVEAQREAIIELVEDLLRDAIIIQSLGFLVGLVSFGTANYGATAINIAKITSEASRFRAMLELLRLYSMEARLTLNAGTTAIAAVDFKLRRFVEARVALRGEAGTIQLGADGRKAKSYLKLHEGGAMGAHTIDRHIGKTDDFLRSRLANETKKMVSTFPNEAVAENSIRSALTGSRASIEAWLKKATTEGLPVQARFEDPVGRVMRRSGEVTEAHGVRAFLVKDSSMPDGYRILSSYPTP